MSNQIPNSQGSSNQTSGGSGLAPNIAAALSYLCGIVTGVIFFFIEKDNREVRFHAMQSIILSIVSILFQILVRILAALPVIGFLAAILSVVVSLGFFVLWILLMVKAYQGEHFKIPYLGDIAEQQMDKF